MQNWNIYKNVNFNYKLKCMNLDQEKKKAYKILLKCKIPKNNKYFDFKYLSNEIHKFKY